jgi:hypothetical protein
MQLVSGWNRLVVLVLMAVMITACDKGEGDNNAGEEKPGHIAGMGNDTRAPEGPIFQLPSGVSVVGSMMGRDGISAPIPNTCAEDGVGKDVIVSMKLKRDSIGGPSTVEFPPGLVIVTAAEGFQKGLLVERTVVRLPPVMPGPGSPSPVCNVTLRLVCLNADKNPSEEFVSYNFGPVTTSPLLKDLINRLAGKKMLLSQYPNDPDWDKKVVKVVQRAVKSLTDDDGLTNTDIQNIGNLPNK